MADDKTQTRQNADFKVALDDYINRSPLSRIEKLQNFARYVPRQYLTYFLSRYELFKKVLNVHGSIIECGVFLGGGLMSFAQLSAIFEPVNHQRRVIGFDTFAGFPGLTDRDREGSSTHKKAGGMAAGAYEDFLEAIRLFDQNRFLPHIPKVHLVKGDAIQTIPAFVADNPHLVVSLLYLDFDLYEPTVAAIKNFLPRMPKGAVIAFDELNMEAWPGETRAVIDEIGIGRLKIERFPFDSCQSFAVIE